MREYTASFDSKKISLKVDDDNNITIDGAKIKTELEQVNDYCFLLKINEKTHEILARKVNEKTYEINIDGKYLLTQINTKLQEKAKEILENKKGASRTESIKSPMPGLILGINKKVGEKVAFGESVLLLEAMKMENEIKSPATGRIKEIFVKKGEKVEKDTLLLIIE